MGRMADGDRFEAIAAYREVRPLPRPRLAGGAHDHAQGSPPERHLRDEVPALSDGPPRMPPSTLCGGSAWVRLSAGGEVGPDAPQRASWNTVSMWTSASVAGVGPAGSSKPHSMPMQRHLTIQSGIFPEKRASGRSIECGFGVVAYSRAESASCWRLARRPAHRAPAKPDCRSLCGEVRLGAPSRIKGCCQPVAPPLPETVPRNSRLYKRSADPTRVQIPAILATASEPSASATSLRPFELGQPTQPTWPPSRGRHRDEFQTGIGRSTASPGCQRQHALQ